MIESVSSLRFLIIDDDEISCDFISITLKSMGFYAFESCQKGKDAVERLALGVKFDVVIVDLKMPGMDGIEIIRVLAASNFSGGIILLSAQDERIIESARNLACAHQLHVLAALSKPLQKSSLEQALFGMENAIKNHGGAGNYNVDINDLIKALPCKEVVTYYQPKWCIRSGKFTSVEALARWIHPQKGFIPPSVFISIAEEDEDVINNLTYCILEQVFQDFGQWILGEGINLSISVNLSAVSLSDIHLPEKLEALSNRHQIPCTSVVLEITESSLIKNLVASLDVLLRLRIKGFGLSIDDFGTGYSSLEQLNKIPFTELKIDKTFVSGLSHNPASKAILESSIALARKLDMCVVAEGVETKEDFDVLTNLFCDVAQGFFIAKPMSLENLISFHQHCPHYF